MGFYSMLLATDSEVQQCSPVGPSVSLTFLITEKNIFLSATKCKRKKVLMKCRIKLETMNLKFPPF